MNHLGEFPAEAVVRFVHWKRPSFEVKDEWARQWYRWTHDDEATVRLDALDPFLVAHDWMLWEFDTWFYDVGLEAA